MQSPHLILAYVPGLPEILIVAVVVVLLFGRGKISGMMGEVASGIKAFQKGMRDDDTSHTQPNRPLEQASTTTARPVPDAAEVDRSKDA
jgi:sec-independent protein translocase protein TatA